MASRIARAENSRAQQAFIMTKATQTASCKQSKEAKNAGDISSFLQQSYRELKVRKAAIQAQLDLLTVNALSAMSDEEKIEFVFGRIDRDGDGTLDVKELASVLRQRSEERSFTESLERAIGFVAKYDVNGDNQLDHEEFKDFLDEQLQ